MTETAQIRLAALEKQFAEDEDHPGRNLTQEDLAELEALRE